MNEHEQKIVRMVFISQPMSGLSDKEISDTRAKMMDYIENISKPSIIPVFAKHKIVPSEKMVRNPHMYQIGADIQLLSMCDELFVAPGFENSVGCNMEIHTAETYGMPIHYVNKKDLEDTHHESN